jgi:hypothetical protein
LALVISRSRPPRRSGEVRKEIEDTIGLEVFHRIEEKTVENQK